MECLLADCFEAGYKSDAKIIYSCLSSNIDIEGESVVTFGIIASKDGSEIDKIIDVSTNQILAQNICTLLNINDVHFEHFRDIVYDFVVSEYMV